MAVRLSSKSLQFLVQAAALTRRRGRGLKAQGIKLSLGVTGVSRSFSGGD